MTRFILSVIVLFTTYFAHSQYTVCLGQDLSVCPGQTVTINNCNQGGGANNVAGVYLNAQAK